MVYFECVCVIVIGVCCSCVVVVVVVVLSLLLLLLFLLLSPERCLCEIFCSSSTAARSVNGRGKARLDNDIFIFMELH